MRRRGSYTSVVRPLHLVLAVTALSGSVCAAFSTQHDSSLSHRAAHHPAMARRSTPPPPIRTRPWWAVAASSPLDDPTAAASDDDVEAASSASSPPSKGVLEILAPCLEAANPRYKCEGPVGHGAFVVTREGGPTADELTNENLLKIVKSECSDLEANTLVWKCLGYRFANGAWDASQCFPKWRERFPEPPDLIGMQRVYERDIDQVSLKSNQALVRSVPAEFKQSLKTFLKPLGFRGFTYAELTPNKTRRAQCTNWLLYYREQLFGVSLDELRARREAQTKMEEEESLRRRRDDENDGAATFGDPEWRPPVREVF